MILNDYPLDSLPLEKAYLIERKGELLDEVFSLTYLGCGSQGDASSLIKRVEQGETVSFLFISSTCSKCTLLEPAFVEVMKAWKGDTTILLDEDNKSQIISYFSGLISDVSYPLSGASPTWYVASKEKGHEILYGASSDKQSNISAIRSGYLDYVSLSNVYRFVDHESFLKQLDSDVPLFLYDYASDESCALMKKINESALTSSKRLYRFDYSSSLDKEKDLVLSAFSNEENIVNGYLLYQKQLYSGQSALELLNSYYA